MKKINQNLKLSVIAAYVREVLSILREALAKLGEGEKDATLELTIKQLEVLADELVDAIKRSAVSSNLEEADNLRDDVLRRLNAILTGYAAFPASFSEKREAAEKLSAVFTKYGLKTALVPFAEETGLLNSLIKEFESEELSALSAKLEAVSETVAELKAANDEFERLSREYSVNTAAAKNLKSASAVKKELLAIFNDSLVPYLNALSVTRKAEYAEISSAAGKAVDRANATAKASKKA